MPTGIRDKSVGCLLLSSLEAESRWASTAMQRILPRSEPEHEQRLGAWTGLRRSGDGLSGHLATARCIWAIK